MKVDDQGSYFLFPEHSTSTNLVSFARDNIRVNCDDWLSGFGNLGLFVVNFDLAHTPRLSLKA